MSRIESYDCWVNRKNKKLGRKSGFRRRVAMMDNGDNTYTVHAIIAEEPCIELSKVVLGIVYKSGNGMWAIYRERYDYTVYRPNVVVDELNRIFNEQYNLPDGNNICHDQIDPLLIN